jgi:hypothetical protein
MNLALGGLPRPAVCVLPPPFLGQGDGVHFYSWSSQVEFAVPREVVVVVPHSLDALACQTPGDTGVRCTGLCRVRSLALCCANCRLSFAVMLCQKYARFARHYSFSSAVTLRTRIRMPDSVTLRMKALRTKARPPDSVTLRTKFVTLRTTTLATLARHDSFSSAVVLRKSCGRLASSSPRGADTLGSLGANAAI